MARREVYLNYFIHLTDAALVAQYRTQYPNGVVRAPYDPDGGPNGGPGGAAIEFGAPFRGYTAPAAEEAPFLWTPYEGNQSGGPYPLDVATFQRKTGGFWGIGGTTTRYYWLGKFVLAAPAPVPMTGTTPTPPAAIAPIPPRRWMDGFERVHSQQAVTYSVDASRHVGGQGHAIRSGNLSSPVRRDINEFGAPNLPASSWERFYLRLRKTPSSPDAFWRAIGGSLAGISLRISPSGDLALYDEPLGDMLIGTVARLTVGQWVKVDVLINWDTHRVRVYLDGASSFDLVVSSTWFPTAVDHDYTELGHFGNNTGLEVDIDDYFNADIPNITGTETLNSPDWLGGTKIVHLGPESFGSGHSVNWTGDVRTLMKRNFTAASAQSALTSSTASALCEVVTDAPIVLGQDAGCRGWLSLLVWSTSSRGASSGTLGYQNGTDSSVNTAITEATLGASYGDANAATLLYRPSLTTARPATEAIKLRYTKGASADAATLVRLGAQLELVGAWGNEDLQPGDTAGLLPAPVAVSHNKPYPQSAWTMPGATGPLSPVIVYSGAYVGTGTGQSLQFRSPIHWLFTRQVAASGSPKWWVSSMLDGHFRTDEYLTPDVALRVRRDQSFIGVVGEDAQQERYAVEIAGANAHFNALGTSYQYIAVSDPGMRFLCNGALLHKGAAACSVALDNAAFLPEFLFGWEEEPDGAVDAAAFVKSSGNAADEVAYLHGTLLADALTFATGSLTTETNLHANLNSGEKQLAFSAWRRNDGSPDPNNGKWFSCGSYTGDGNATRSLNIGTLGRRPLFAIIAPHNTNNAYLRDPAHASTTSVDAYSGTDASTGITAGQIDGLTVGSALNANAVVHSYFVIWSDTATAGNNGWGIDPPTGFFVPVEADIPYDGWPPVPDTVPEDPDSASGGGGTGTGDLDDTTAILTSGSDVGGQVGGQTCEFYTRALFNMALSRLGISKAIADLNADDTEMAALARRHVREDVNQVLRDFDWPWATAYATLTLVGGTSTAPVNKDWQYSYRGPVGMMKARRLVPQADQRRAFDPDPIPFRLATDTSGHLIYCNSPATSDVPLVLEYTARNACPAFWGDVLFRDALAWKFAASLAQPLCRDSEKQTFCLQMYQLALHRANVPASQEQQQEKDGDAPWISDRG